LYQKMERKTGLEPDVYPTARLRSNDGAGKSYQKAGRLASWEFFRKLHGDHGSGAIMGSFREDRAIAFETRSPHLGGSVGEVGHFKASIPAKNVPVDGDWERLGQERPNAIALFGKGDRIDDAQGLWYTPPLAEH